MSQVFRHLFVFLGLFCFYAEDSGRDFPLGRGGGIFVRDGRFFVYWANERAVDITNEGNCPFFILFYRVLRFIGE